MNIIGGEKLSQEEVARKIFEGYRLVSYQYCVSILVLTFRRSSAIYLLGPAESGASVRTIYGAISLLLGWWGLPWGPIYTVQSLSNVLSGGTQHSQAYLQKVATDFNLLVPNAPPLIPSSERIKTSGLAIASFCLSLAGVLLLGPFGAIPGVICGHIALIQIKRNGSQKGRKLAIAGLVLGYLTILFYLAFITWLVLSAK